MKILKKSLLLLSLLPLLSIGSVHGTVVADRGGVRDNAGADVRADDLRDGVYGNGAGYGAGYVNPGYGYPAGAYPQNYNAFPDDSEENSLFKANEHAGEL